MVLEETWWLYRQAEYRLTCIAAVFLLEHCHIPSDPDASIRAMCFADQVKDLDKCGFSYQL